MLREINGKKESKIFRCFKKMKYLWVIFVVCEIIFTQDGNNKKILS